MAKYQVGDKFYEDEVNWDVEIVSVASELDTNETQSYFIKVTDKDDGSTFFDAIDEEILDEAIYIEQFRG